jgi:hypothetical protein
MAITLADAKATARATIDAQFGPIPGGLSSAQTALIEARRDQLAFSIASQSPYVRDNAVVEPNTLAILPADIIAPSGGGPCSGDGLVHLGTGTLS